MPTELWDSLWNGRDEQVGLYETCVIFRGRQQGRLGRNKHRKTEEKGLLHSVTLNIGLCVSPCWVSQGSCWPSPAAYLGSSEWAASSILTVAQLGVTCNLGTLHCLLQVTDEWQAGQVLFFQEEAVQDNAHPPSPHKKTTLTSWLPWGFDAIQLVKAHFLDCFVFFCALPVPISMLLQY